MSAEHRILRQLKSRKCELRYKKDASRLVLIARLADGRTHPLIEMLVASKNKRERKRREMLIYTDSKSKNKRSYF